MSAFCELSPESQPKDTAVVSPPPATPGHLTPPPDALSNCSSLPTFLGHHSLSACLYPLSCKKKSPEGNVKWFVLMCTHSYNAAGLQGQFIILRRVCFILSLHLICLPFIRWAPELSLHHRNSAGMYTMPAIWRGLTCVEYVYSVSGCRRSLTGVIYGASVGGWRSSHLAFHNA